MYKTSPINKNKVLSGLQNFTFDEIENYRTHVFEKHSVMDDTKNLDLVLRGKKQHKVVLLQTLIIQVILTQMLNMQRKLLVML